MIIWQKHQGLRRKNKFVKVFLVLVTEQTSERIAISDLRSTSSQYLIFQLVSSIKKIFGSLALSV